jgi:hypothetical protein
MTGMTGTDGLVADYRDRLRRATADLPPGRRAELLDDIDAHLAEATADAPDDASVRQVLDDLGTPEAIADAARSEAGTSAPVRSSSGDTVYDVATVLVLLLGGFVVPVLGWLAGVVMLWNGPRWTTGDRWLGTLAWPVAIALPIAVVVVPNAVASTGHWIVLGLGVLSLVLLTWCLVHLLRVAARRR